MARLGKLWEHFRVKENSGPNSVQPDPGAQNNLDVAGAEDPIDDDEAFCEDLADGDHEASSEDEASSGFTAEDEPAGGEARAGVEEDSEVADAKPQPPAQKESVRRGTRAGRAKPRPLWLRRLHAIVTCGAGVLLAGSVVLPREVLTGLAMLLVAVFAVGWPHATRIQWKLRVRTSLLILFWGELTCLLVHEFGDVAMAAVAFAMGLISVFVLEMARNPREHLAVTVAANVTGVLLAITGATWCAMGQDEIWHYEVWPAAGAILGAGLALLFCGGMRVWLRTLLVGLGAFLGATAAMAAPMIGGRGRFGDIAVLSGWGGYSELAELGAGPAGDLNNWIAIDNGIMYRGLLEALPFLAGRYWFLPLILATLFALAAMLLAVLVERIFMGRSPVDKAAVAEPGVKTAGSRAAGSPAEAGNQVAPPSEVTTKPLTNPLALVAVGLVMPMAMGVAVYALARLVGI